MASSLVHRFREWLAGRFNRESEPEFNTREEYFRWKAAQQPQSAMPAAAPPAKPPKTRPAQAEKVREGPAVCPYCGEAFSSFPKRKRKCPSCENVIVIWRGRDRKERVLVTEARAAALVIEGEEERAKIKAQYDADPERRVRRVARAVDGYGFSDEEIRGQVSVSASEGDAKWALLQQATLRYMGEGDFDRLASVYHTKALQLDQEGKNFQRMLAQVSEMKLRAIQKLERECPGMIQGVKIESSQLCATCKRSDGKRFSIQQAFELRPLPCKGCTCRMKSEQEGFCNCDYSIEFSDE
jgi:hypothetical protein